MACKCGRANNYTIAQALENQRENLKPWRKLLKPAYYSLLKTVVDEVTGRYNICGHLVPRGDQIRLVVMKMGEGRKGKELVQFLDGYVVLTSN